MNSITLKEFYNVFVVLMEGLSIYETWRGGKVFTVIIHIKQNYEFANRDQLMTISP